MARLAACAVAVAAVSCAALAAAADVTIASFDGTPGTTLEWQTMNDPVMGGRSVSAVGVDRTRSLAVWQGEVKSVLFLPGQPPGFCSMQTVQGAQFPKELSSTEGIGVRLRQTLEGGLTNYNFQLMTASMPKNVGWTWRAAFGEDVGHEMAGHFIPWSAFKCMYRGQEKDPKAHPEGCGGSDLSLADISMLGISTNGKVGSFQVEIERIVATDAMSKLETSAWPTVHKVFV